MAKAMSSLTIPSQRSCIICLNCAVEVDGWAVVCGRVPGSTVVAVDELAVVVDGLAVVVDGRVEGATRVVSLFFTDLVVVGKLGGAVSPQLDKMMAAIGRKSFAPLALVVE